MQEFFAKLLTNDVVIKLIADVIVWLVMAGLVWAGIKIKAKAPAELVDRMWDFYLGPIAKAVFDAAQRQFAVPSADASWKQKLLAEALQELQEQWNRLEDTPLTQRQLEAATGELKATIEKATNGG